MDGVNSYLYDAEGKICAMASTPVPGLTTMIGYLYNADGVRVSKGSITAWSCDISSNGYKTIQDYVIGPGGDAVSEVGMNADGSMSMQRTYVSAAGKLIATYDANGLHFRATDWLGSMRASTDARGVLEEESSMLPFGDQLTGDLLYPDSHHFTGKERDSESGNDYFGARYYASTMGRFLSPDWSAKAEPVPYAKLDDPQNLNLYAYVENNPLGRADADGHGWRDSLAAAANFIRDTTLKVEVGLGIGAKVRGSGTLETSARVGLKLSAPNGDSKIELITERAAQASITDKSGTERGVGNSVEKTVNAWHTKTNELTGEEAPKITSQASMSTEKVSASVSADEFSLEAGGYAGLGASVSLSGGAAAVQDLTDVVKGITDYFSTPDPPPTPKPPTSPTK